MVHGTHYLLVRARVVGRGSLAGVASVRRLDRPPFECTCQTNVWDVRIKMNAGGAGRSTELRAQSKRQRRSEVEENK